MLRLDTEQVDPISPALESELMTAIQESMPQVTACVLSDYAKGLLTPTLCASILQLGRECRVPVIVDPKGRDYRKYVGANVLTPNLQEAAIASGLPVENHRPPDQMARQLQHLMPDTTLLITRGEEGMSLYAPDRSPLHIPAMSRAVYDVTGAGDTVVAVLALTLACGMPIEEATVLANLAAGEVVSKLGASTVTTDELRRAIAESSTASLLVS
jgi:D-beta-D-heptose 7-phosphate kinase/D-beta-D-heptose 1-phosphate adenosyltransferase